MSRRGRVRSFQRDAEGLLVARAAQHLGIGDEGDAERRLSRRASRQGFAPAPGVAAPVRVASPPPAASFAPPPDAPRPTPSKPLKELVATISKELGLAPGLSLSAALAEAARLMGVEPKGTLPQQAAVLVAAISGA